jgi:drug/metabolite transporter (DMT)-like permease
MFFKEIEFEIILIAICVTFIYGLSPITYKLLVINNKIKFETYLFISSIIFFISTMIYIFFFHDFNEIYNQVANYNSSLLLLLVINVFIVSFFSQILYCYILDNVDKVHKITIIIGLYPIITLILSVLVLNEKINLRTLIGFIIAIIGISIIFY